MGSGKQTRRVLVFAGSTREGSVNKRLAKAAAEALSRSGLGVTYVDLRDYPMPLYDGDLEVGTGVPETARVLKQLLRDQAALVIASPEYNGSYSGVLKNVIDWVSRPEPGERPAAAFRGKTAALMAASPGVGGGKRGLQHVRELLHNIGVSTIPAEGCRVQCVRGIR